MTAGDLYSSLASVPTRPADADLVLATAPSRTVIEATPDGLAPAGELVAVAVPEAPIRLPLGPLVNDRLTVRGWSSGHSGDAEETLQFGARHGIDPAVETYALAAASAAVGDMCDDTVRFRAVPQCQQ